LADNGVKVTVDAKDFQLAMNKLPRLFMTNMVEAGQKVGKEVIMTKGLKIYPSETSANSPPTPYYIRGRGMQRTSRAGVSYNDNSSERYGTQWHVKSNSRQVKITNEASYSGWLAGAKQGKAMRRIGWKKITVVIAEKMKLIKAIFQSHIGRAIRQAGFRFK
jgi:hypothetical protein